MKPGQNVLQGDENGVAHVQPSRDVGRRHGKYVRRLGWIVRRLGVREEAAGAFPPAVDLVFEEGGVVRGAAQAGGLVGEIVAGVAKGGTVDSVGGAVVVMVVDGGERGFLLGEGGMAGGGARALPRTGRRDVGGGTAREGSESDAREGSSRGKSSATSQHGGDPGGGHGGRGNGGGGCGVSNGSGEAGHGEGIQGHGMAVATPAVTTMA